MKQCETCIFFNEESNNLFGSTDDILVQGETEEERFYCGPFFDQSVNVHHSIPQRILADKETCPHRVPKL